MATEKQPRALTVEQISAIQKRGLSLLGSDEWAALCDQARAHAACVPMPVASARAPIAHDAVNPSHYRGDLVMRIIEKFRIGFRLGNVVKYVLRHEDKAGLEDLKKARWYLDREITEREGSDFGGLQ